MNISIMYPCDYFNKKKIDEEYLSEYKVAIELGFNVVVIDFEALENGTVRLTKNEDTKGLCIYRGWMLKPETYKMLFDKLYSNGLELINGEIGYCNCHEFPYSYSLLKQFTPKMSIFLSGKKINWDVIKSEYDRFMIKDFVKSVKGSDFPIYFDKSYSNEDLDEYIQKFKDLRGDLFTTGIVIKEFVDLKKENGLTNEYRAFYLQGQLISLCKNSNQGVNTKVVPDSLIRQLPLLESSFYTVDFAEKENGEFVVIETGDGQVSGLSDNQDITEFYMNIKKVMNI